MLVENQQGLSCGLFNADIIRQDGEDG